MKKSISSKKVSNLKKYLAAVICIVLSAAFLTACASPGSFNTSSEVARMAGGGDSMDYAISAAPPPQAAPMPEAVMANDMMHYDEAESMYSYTAREEAAMIDAIGLEMDSTAIQTSEPVADNFAEKIIYSVYADLETRNFDETIENVRVLMDRYHAFIESSSISGVNYASRHYGWDEFRYAYFSLRVPKENLNAMTSSLGTLGNVVHESSNAMNITSQFYDTQSRLNSLIVQESRLLEMLASAEDVPDLIMIEERLSNVRYQVESLTTTLNNWQSQVDYSTLTISIREVEEFTEQVQIHRTYWEQMYDGFMATIRATGRFFMNLFMWIVVNAPVLIILAVVAIVALLTVKMKLRKNKQKKIKEAEVVEGYANLPLANGADKSAAEESKQENE